MGDFRRPSLVHPGGRGPSEEDLVQNAGSVVAVSKYGSVRRLPLADLRATAKPGSVVAKAILGPVPRRGLQQIPVRLPANGSARS